MIVVINPSGGAGRSFKGLHNYCSHDVDAKSNERVEWVETRNLGTDDPELAWKLMARTAQSQNRLKQNAGIKPGPAPKDGPVLHVVLSFDNDEPSDHKTAKAAADEFLSQLGVDPAKMRAKNKPKRRQFADEHQVIMYSHRDTKNTHVHLMINRIHPETGILLPTNKDQIKAQKWALEFSKRHGTNDKTPAREQNYENRKSGEFVKGPKRKSRNLYDLNKALAASANDNDRLNAFKASEREKNAAMAKRGRDLKYLHDAQWNKLVGEDKQQSIKLKSQLQADIAQAKINNNHAFRPQWKAMREQQANERTKFQKMERSLIGRSANMLKTYALSADDTAQNKTNALSRAIKVITSPEARKEVFDRALAQERSSLKREQSNALAKDFDELKNEYKNKLAAKDQLFKANCSKLVAEQKEEILKLRQAWKERNADRSEALKSLGVEPDKSKSKNNNIELKKEYLDALMLEIELRQEMVKARDHAREQDNSKDKDGYDPT